MTSPRHDAYDAGLLVAFALEPKRRPTKSDDYRRLLERFEREREFRQLVEEFCKGLRLVVLESGRDGLVLGCHADSVFATRLGDFRKGTGFEDRVAYGLVYLAAQTPPSTNPTPQTAPPPRADAPTHPPKLKNRAIRLPPRDRVQTARIGGCHRSIRQSHMVMVGRMRVITGPGNYNNYRELPHLVIPADDPGIVATFHYYDPFHCTHQGALWIGAEAVRAEVQAAFDGAVAWAKKHGVEMYVGEFGAYEKADRESRIRWMEFIAAECRARGMSSAYWEFCRGFGAFGPVAESWREPLLRALLPKRNPANTE